MTTPPDMHNDEFIWSIFSGRNGDTVVARADDHVVTQTGECFPLSAGAVVDFLRPFEKSPVGVAVLPSPQASAPKIAEVSTSMVEHYDAVFAAPDQQETPSDSPPLYDNLFTLPAVNQAGHFQRMALIAELAANVDSTHVVVDFGTGPWGFGCIAPDLRKAGVCIGVDISVSACQQGLASFSGGAGQRVLYVTSDGSWLPFADNSIDFFFAGESIEHVEYAPIWLREVARVLKPNGKLLLTTPNRDALYYGARGVPYTAGPEHTYLMSYGELVDHVERCFDVDACYGYESSLDPETDRNLTNQTLIDAVQRRAKNFPDLASGLVMVSSVNKGKFRRQSASRVVAKLSWMSLDPTCGTMRPIRLFDEFDGGFIVGKAPVVLQRSSSENLLLLLRFWAHSWSGLAEVRNALGATLARVDCYAHSGGFVYCEVVVSATDMPVKVCRAGEKRAEAMDDQVIFVSATFISR